MKQISDLDMKTIDNNIWTYFLKSLQENENNKHGFWTDGEEILCKTEEQAEAVADFLEDLGFDCLNTGYYDPVEDKREGCVDDHTGYWYINNN